MTITLNHLIGGQPQSANAYLPVHDPATGQVFAQCPDGDAGTVDAAVAAATVAAPGWAALPCSERARWLNRLADALEGQLEQFAAAESRDAGKPLALARDIEIPRAVSNLRFFAAAASQFASESHHGEAGLNYTLRQALGVVGCISPWNLPLYLFTWKIAPALAAGNCVVGKPSEITPVSAWMLGELARDVGFPPGVLNIVHGLGDRVGAPLVAHPGIKAISFTGSTAVGRRIGELCGRELRKVSLELGGKNPSIVFADAPREQLIPTLLRAGFQNSGQICLCGSRVLIQRSVYAEIRDALVAGAAQLSVGDPQDAGTRLGPLVSAAHHAKVMACIERARADGGRILTGGHALQPAGRCHDGWFIAPTVIEGLPDDCATHHEEIFGPVITLQPFDDLDHAIALANSNRYGLAANLWTRDLATAHLAAQRLHAGIVWINTWLQRDLRTPFGGVGDSGMGREGGFEALRFFTEPKNVCLALT